MDRGACLQSMAGCSPWGHKELDTTNTFTFFLSVTHLNFTMLLRVSPILCLALEMKGGESPSSCRQRAHSLMEEALGPTSIGFSFNI